MDRMIEWKNRYPQAPETFPKKYWIHTQNDKVQIRIKVQSKEKLFKYLEKVMTAYENLISDIDSMAELHHIPSLSTLGKEKTWEQVNQEIQAFLQPIRQVAATPDLLASQENLVKFVVTQFGFTRPRMLSQVKGRYSSEDMAELSSMVEFP